MPARRYTEEQFRTAVADPEVRTMADLCRAVGIVPRGANYETLRAYGQSLGLEVDRSLTLRWLGVSESGLSSALGESTSMGALLRHLGLPDRSGIRARLRGVLGSLAPDDSPLPVGPDGRRARRSYTDEQLRTALTAARNYGELCAELDLQAVSGTYRRLREHAKELGLVIPATWSRPGPTGPDGVPRRARQPLIGPPKPPPASYDPAALRSAVAKATCIAEAIRSLGDLPNSTTRRRIANDLRRHEVDTSHFLASAPHGGRARRPIEELLVYGARVDSGRLRRRLLDEGLKESRCEACSRSRWNGQPIPLELDHVDGDRWNNLLANLRVLCPNCHALTPTYRGRNIGKHRRHPSDVNHSDPGGSERASTTHSDA